MWPTFIGREMSHLSVMRARFCRAEEPFFDSMAYTGCRIIGERQPCTMSRGNPRRGNTELTQLETRLRESIRQIEDRWGARASEIEQQIQNENDKPRGWSPMQTLQWAKDKPRVWVPIFLTALAVIISYFAWLQPQWKAHAENDLKNTIQHEIDAKLTDHHFDELASDVKTMKGQLGEMDGFLRLLAEKELHQQASIPKDEFKRQIPTFAATVSVARVVHASVAPELITGISRKLASSEMDESDYWKAAAEFVSYRSDLKVSFAPEQLPDCFSQPNHSVINLTMEHGRGSAVLPMSHCRLDIGIDQLEALKSFASRAIAGAPFSSIRYSLDLTDVQVIYRGGPIIPVAGLILHDCLFQIELQENVPAPAKTLTRELLASDKST